MRECEKCGEIHQKNGKPTCVGHRRDKHFCTKFPVNGSTVCDMHGGRAPQVKRKAAEVVQATEIRKLCAALGLHRDIGHIDGLLELVAEAAGNTEFYRQLVNELPTHPEADTYDLDTASYTRGEPGIYGRTYHESGMPTGEGKPHVLVTMYDAERDRWAKLCLELAKLNIDERRVRLAEADAQRIFGAIGKALNSAGLTPEQIEVVRRDFAANLRSAEPVGLTR